MREECIEAVAQAIGRPLKRGEADDIEKTILSNMQRIAREDPQAWAGMGKAERYQVAAESAAKQMLEDAKTKHVRTALNVVARAKTASQFHNYQLAGIKGANAVERILNNVNSYVKGVQKESFSHLMDTMIAAEPRFFGFKENTEAVHNFIYEVFGKDSGSDVAKKGAKVWLDTIEQLRQRFNRGGGDIGKLDYGYIPQTHNQVSVLKAGMEKWRDTIAPLLDRSRYVDENGNKMGDTEFMTMLAGVWETLSSGGTNKLDPNNVSFGGTSFANRGSKSREIHFSSPEAWITYHNQFGRGTLFEAMQNHVNALARNIGVIEEMGPTPRSNFDMLKIMAQQADGKISSVGAAFGDLDALYKVLTGENNHAANPQIAEFNQGVRNFIAAAKLQGTPLSSVTDIATLFATAHYHNLPVLQTMGNVFKSFGKDYQDYANTVGLVADSMISDMTRFADGNYSQGWTAKWAHATNKISLLNAWTDSLKRGFQITLMGALGKMHGTPWEKLNTHDLKRLEFQGITKDIYDTWQLASPENWRGSKMLTPDSIRNIRNIDPSQADAAVTKLLAYIVDESEYAITTPDLTTRASLGGGTQKGTFQGEVFRHLSLFKSFPLAMANRHIRRVMSMNGEQGNFGYGVSLMVGLIAFGALSTQLKALRDGQDPIDMFGKDWGKFWGRAVMQGGGFGIYGDLLYTGMGGNNRNGSPNYASFAGPVFGTAFDAANVTLGNIGEWMRGEKTDAGAELLRFTKQNAPFINTWYAKAAIDHLVLQDLQESLSPGYLNRMKARTYKDFGQRYWWEPAENLPDRAPDFANAIGE